MTDPYANAPTRQIMTTHGLVTVPERQGVRGPANAPRHPRPLHALRVGKVITEGSEPCGCHWRSEVGPESASSTSYQCPEHRAQLINRRYEEVKGDLDLDLLRRALNR